MSSNYQKTAYYTMLEKSKQMQNFTTNTWVGSFEEDEKAIKHVFAHRLRRYSLD